MIYLVFGEQKLLINKMVSKILKENLDDINEFNHSKYDATKVPLYEIISDLETTSLFLEKKMVLIENCYFLTGEKPKLPFEEDFIDFERYLDIEDDNNDLILMVETAKLDERKKIVKKIKDKAKVYALETLKGNDLVNAIRKMFKIKGVEIQEDALKEFLNRVKDDMFLISNEIEKLSLYSSSITLNDVKHLTSKKLEDNVFEILDYLLDKKSNKLFDVYYDLKENMVDPVMLIALISNQVRFLYQVFSLDERGFLSQNIANELSVHPYRVKLALDKVNYLSKKDLENLLYQLQELDYSIKSGKIDKYVGFEIFLAKNSV